MLRQTDVTKKTIHQQLPLKSKWRMQWPPSNGRSCFRSRELQGHAPVGAVRACLRAFLWTAAQYLTTRRFRQLVVRCADENPIRRQVARPAEKLFPQYREEVSP